MQKVTEVYASLVVKPDFCGCTYEHYYKKVKEEARFGESFDSF
jgi:hypothetical protein